MLLSAGCWDISACSVFSQSASGEVFNVRPLSSSWAPVQGWRKKTLMRCLKCIHVSERCLSLPKAPGIREIAASLQNLARQS